MEYSTFSGWNRGLLNIFRVESWNTSEWDDARLEEIESPSTMKPSSQTWDNLFELMPMMNVGNGDSSGGDPDRAIQEGSGKPSLQVSYCLRQAALRGGGKYKYTKIQLHKNTITQIYNHTKKMAIAWTRPLSVAEIKYGNSETAMAKRNHNGNFNGKWSLRLYLLVFDSPDLNLFERSSTCHISLCYDVQRD